jgi:hypothetical protein
VEKERQIDRMPDSVASLIRLKARSRVGAQIAVGCRYGVQRAYKSSLT